MLIGCPMSCLYSHAIDKGVYIRLAKQKVGHYTDHFSRMIKQSKRILILVENKVQKHLKLHSQATWY